MGGRKVYKWERVAGRRFWTGKAGLLGRICINITDGWVGMGDFAGRRMLHGGDGFV